MFGPKLLFRGAFEWMQDAAINRQENMSIFFRGSMAESVIHTSNSLQIPFLLLKDFKAKQLFFPE
jgi:hypothetical protein